MFELENVANQLAEIFMKYLKYKKVSDINFNESELSFFLLSDGSFGSLFSSKDFYCELNRDVEFVEKQLSLLGIYIDREKLNIIKTSLKKVKSCDDFLETLRELFNLIIEHFEIIGKSLNNTWDFFEELILKINSIHSNTLISMGEHVECAQDDVKKDSDILEKIYGLGEQIEKADDLQILKNTLMKSVDDLADLVKENIKLKEERYVTFNEHFLRLKKDIDEYKSQTEKLKSSVEKYRIESFTDYLTGLYNRKYMSLRLEEEQERLKRFHSPFVLLMLDIDNFKQINDTYGHIVGDYVLKYIANIIRENIREIDVGFRFGGEEFLILLPETDLKSSCNVAERLRSKIMHTVFKFKDKKIKITVSQGLAEYHEGEHYTDTIERADKLLLKAKQMGKNRVVCE